MLVRRLIVNVVNFYSSQAIVVKREIYRICEAAIVMCYILRLFETEIGSAVRSGQSSAGGRPTRRKPRSPGTARHSNDWWWAEARKLPRECTTFGMRNKKSNYTLGSTFHGVSAHLLPAWIWKINCFDIKSTHAELSHQHQAQCINAKTFLFGVSKKAIAKSISIRRRNYF